MKQERLVSITGIFIWLERHGEQSVFIGLHVTQPDLRFLSTMHSLPHYGSIVDIINPVQGCTFRRVTESTAQRLIITCGQPQILLGTHVAECGKPIKQVVPRVTSLSFNHVILVPPPCLTTLQSFPIPVSMFPMQSRHSSSLHWAPCLGRFGLSFPEQGATGQYWHGFEVFPGLFHAHKHTTGCRWLQQCVVGTPTPASAGCGPAHAQGPTAPWS